MTGDRMSRNVRDAYEQTDEHLSRLQGLIFAIDALYSAANTSRCEHGAIVELMTIVLEIMEAVEGARRREWVALGGREGPPSA